MLPRMRAALPIGLLGLLSCQQPPDISGEIDEHAALVNETNTLACDCPQDLGYPTGVECDEALGTVDAMNIQCMADALEGSEDAAKDYLACANAALRIYAQCLASNPGCQDGWYLDCSRDVTNATEACPQLPTDVLQTFGACKAF